MMKKAIRLCSILLIIALFVNMLPMQVLGQMYQNSLTAVQPVVNDEAVMATEAETLKDVKVVGEVTAKRTKYSKEHLLSNGLHMMTLYPDAVHYETDTGWEEIDNTLKLTTDGTYTNTAGVWDVHLPQQISAGKPVTVTKDGYTLSFAMTGQMLTSDLQVSARTAVGAEETLSISSAKTVAAQVQKVDNTELQQSLAHPETLPDKLTSRLAYKNIYSNTDILYDLDSNKVKESVVLQHYDSTLRGYRYTLDVGTMIPVLEEDGQITFYAPDKETVVMVMPAPFLVDAENRYNFDVQVQLTGSGSSYTLTYLLPQTWLADSSRAWPVILDPVVEADFAASNIQDQTVAETDTYTHTWGMGEVGYANGYGAERFFIKYETLPTLTSADVVVYATMQLCTNKAGGSTPMQVHKVSDTWSSTEITWANQPEFGEYIEDYAILDDPGYYSFEVTEIVRDWYANKNTGMVFRFSDDIEEGTENNWVQFYSSDYGTNKPVLSVMFRNSAGLEDYWDYTASTAGRAGTGYVNQYTGNLVWVREDMGFGGNRMPVAISHVYNANESATNLFGLGYGWRTNFNQRVYHWDDDNASGDYYIWEDADGTKHYFLKSSTNVYKDEDGLELTLKTSGSGTKKYSITDKYGNVSYFDTYGRLTQQTNNQATKSSITVTYTSTSGLNISTITDGVGRVYSFTYSSSLLSKIAYKSTGTSEITYVNFGYSSSNLTTVTDKDGEVSTYTYTSNHLLSSATDVDGYKISYAYNTTTAGKPNRIKSITEYDGSVLGGALTIKYTQNKTTITDHQGNQQVMQFNNWGNTISAYDSQGRAVYSQFASNDPEETGKGNQLTLSSKMQNTVGNHITSSDFDKDVTYTNSSGKITNSVATGTAYSGNKSLKIVTNETAEGSKPYVYYSSYTINAGDSGTYSAYLKTGAVPSSITIYDGTNEVKSETLAAGSDWTRLQVTYTNTGTEAVTVRLRTRVWGVGTTYMDCVQFETAAAASRFNLVGNGDFRNTQYWSSSSGRVDSSNPAPAPELNDKIYKLVGSPTSTKRISQTIPISGSKGDSYVLGGWAKGRSAPLADDRTFGMIAVFNNSDDTKTTFKFSFNPYVSTWQYLSGAIVAAKAYSSITLYLVFDYNVNKVYFDGIQLFKETFGQSYTYDGNGNVTSVTDLQNQKTTYTYSNNNLTKEVLPSGAELTYTYDSYHNVLTAATAEGVDYKFTYDTYGNNTSVTAVYSTNTLTSKAAYTSDGNRLASTTDTAGFTTKYSYNANTNVLEYTRSPEQTSSTQTNYTYDQMYRLATAAATTDSGLAQSAAYTYSDDYLTKIATPSTDYTFTYGNFGMRTKVKAGSNTLATYTYADRTNYLTELDFGNGDSVKYTYNEQGQLLKEKYTTDGKNTGTVTYRYGNSGELASVEDAETGITQYYTYDLLDRLGKYRMVGDDHEASLSYTYDKNNNVSKAVEIIDGSDRSYTITYDEDNRVATYRKSYSKVAYDYDSYNRLDTRVVTHTKTDQEIYQEDYTYYTPGDNQRSLRVAKYRVFAADGYDVTYSYTYDDNGNILSVSDGTNKTTYVYDSANQLIRENNPVGNFTYVWTYDGAGNILSRKEYAYTTGTLGTVKDTVTYSYGNSTWGDLLTKVESYTYCDGIGNPLNNDARAYKWKNGRELARLAVTSDFTIVTHPKDVSCFSSETAVFSVTAAGSGLTYQWQYKSGSTWKNYTGTGAKTKTISVSASGNDGKVFRCVVTNGDGTKLFSKTATLKHTTIRITSLSPDWWGPETGTAEFTVQAVSTSSSLSYRWKWNNNGTWTNSAASGATTNKIRVGADNDNGTTYRCWITDAEGNTVISDSVTIHTDPLGFIKQPVDCYCPLSGNATFSVQVYGTDLSYQWQWHSPSSSTWKNSAATGATTSAMSVGVTNDNGTVYRCKVTDGDGNVIYSQSATVIPYAINWEYEYDADGLRTKRTNGTTTYEYIYLADQLVKMIVDSVPMTFAYDAEGKPISIYYNNTAFYYYVTNLQGDVVGIIDKDGNKVVTYNYDAWGNLLSITGSKASTLGAHNPLRYRGYVYDTETGLYYLQSRYYDPAVGRFVNADGLVSTGQGLLGNNMFAYCLNNPVVFEDSLGLRPIASTSVANETAGERKVACDYMRGSISGIDNSLNVLEVVNEVTKSLWNNLEFSAGVGQGLYGELDVLDLASVQIGMYGNYASLRLEDGQFSFGQELNQGISASLFGYNLGANEYRFNENGVDTIKEINTGIYTDETWTIFSVAIYPMAGFSARIGFDVVKFCEDWYEIVH